MCEQCLACRPEREVGTRCHECKAGEDPSQWVGELLILQLEQIELESNAAEGAASDEGGPAVRRSRASPKGRVPEDRRMASLRMSSPSAGQDGEREQCDPLGLAWVSRGIDPVDVVSCYRAWPSSTKRHCYRPWPGSFVVLQSLAIIYKAPLLQSMTKVTNA